MKAGNSGSDGELSHYSNLPNKNLLPIVDKLEHIHLFGKCVSIWEPDEGELYTPPIWEGQKLRDVYYIEAEKLTRATEYFWGSPEDFAPELDRVYKCFGKKHDGAFLIVKTKIPERCPPLSFGNPSSGYEFMSHVHFNAQFRAEMRILVNRMNAQWSAIAERAYCPALTKGPQP